ncbi:MAG: type II toxin-antitoxin system RelB/DinJ family antitoxin [bacterium]|nr:type II toxin-antitoxin system RelB/DinJ family antitoxin [bacterium]MCM1423314.1 type II toxin-antitoxin system RelB/DinJ family antitoxin [bacterium]
MAEQALVQVRLDKDLRDEVADIYAKMGLDIPTAIRMFFARTKIEKGIPFETTLPRTDEKMLRERGLQALENIRINAETLPEMTPDEINAEIAAIRAKQKEGR